MQAHTQGCRGSSESRVTRVCCPLSIRNYSQSKMPRTEMSEKYDFFGLSLADVLLLGPFGQVKPRNRKYADHASQSLVERKQRL